MMKGKFRVSLLLLLIVVLPVWSGSTAFLEKKSLPPLPRSPGPPEHTDAAFPAPGKILKTIIVDNYYPYTFINQNGLPDGFSVDLMRAVVSIMGLSVDIQVGPWDTAVKDLESGQIDFLPMMAYSPARDRLFDFSAPHTIAFDAVFVRKGSLKVRSLEDLRGKTIIVMNMDAADDFLISNGLADKAKLIRVNSLPEALRLLSAGKGDGAIMPKLVGLVLIKHFGLTNLEQSPVIIDAYSRPFSFAVKEGHQALLERLTQGLSIVKATGQYQAIYDKWFGAVDSHGISLKTTLTYIALIFASFALIGIGLLLWNFSLKRQVAQRTKTLEMEITERKRAEEALRESEERIRWMAEKAKDILFRMSLPDGTYEYVSSAATQITGYTPEEYYANPILIEKIIHPQRQQYFRDQWNDLLKGRVPSHYEFQILHKSGEVRWINQRNVLVRNQAGKPIAIEGIATDITERKLAEEQIENLKNYLSNIIDSMPSVLVGMDEETRVTQWNRKAEEATGIPTTEAIGRPIAEILPDFFPWITAIRSEIEQHRMVSVEKFLIEQDGRRRFYDLMLYPLTTNGVKGSILRIEEVTEKTHIQELMIQTEKMISLGGLAAGMAHEINNPLGIITQAVQNIERRISRDLPGNRVAAEEAGVSLPGIKAYFESRQIPDFIASILEASSRASRIITNMLRFGGSNETTMHPASLSGILDQALELAGSDYDLKKKYDFKSIEIIRDCQPVPEIPMVAVEMEQVLLNLLKNAAQAMMANPPERKPRITIRIRRENRYVLLEVEDNGSGMTEDIRRRVFEPFFTTKDPGIGTGLGLSVSYMIVTQNHKGLMEVESTPGKGTCFTISLPLSTPAREPA